MSVGGVFPGDRFACEQCNRVLFAHVTRIYQSYLNERAPLALHDDGHANLLSSGWSLEYDALSSLTGGMFCLRETPVVKAVIRKTPCK